MLNGIVISVCVLLLIASSIASDHFELAMGRLSVSLHSVRAWGIRVRPRLSKSSNHERREMRRGG